MAYCTTALVKTYLGITGSADDTLIGTLVVRAQAMIDKYCDRTFEASANTTNYFDAIRNTNRMVLLFSEGLELATTPTTVVNGDLATLVVNTDFVTMPTNKPPFYGLRILPSVSSQWIETSAGNSERAVQVTGKWAYSETAPDDIVAVTVRLVSFLYRQRDQSGELDRPVSVADGMILLPGRLPADIASILQPYRRHGY